MIGLAPTLYLATYCPNCASGRRNRYLTKFPASVSASTLALRYCDVGPDTIIR